MRGLDLDIALTLGTSRESKRTFRNIDDDALSTLVWVVDKLVKTYSRRRPNMEIGLVNKA